jgi:large subunit ribosomal protein L14e
MIEIGRIVVKIAGRDAGKKGIVVDVLDNGNYVLIDGQVRRKKCNIKHIEPLPKVLKIKKNASHDDIKKLFLEEKIEIKEKKQKQKEKTKKPVKKRKTKKKATSQTKSDSKQEKKVTKVKSTKPKEKD